METLKCKVCGGSLVIDAESNLGTCEYCGTVQTITKSPDNEEKIRLFNMGNRHRTAGEFDRAIALFEKVTEMDDSDAEAHWCLALSRHGIEYVSSAGRYIPTCHRVGVQTILQDLDYQAALEHASLDSKGHYEQAATEIAEIEKRIYAISQREQPFDVFICYKETDDKTGQRTQDSVDAQDIYFQLRDKGYRVFFARITLESKGGEEYEPYIYAALHSAKVMIVIGSQKEYFESAWVKNEWSRYLSIIREEQQHNGYSSRLLIPCYRNIDAYDIPDNLNIFQSHDMGKIGFVQDLLHGITKVIEKKAPALVAKESPQNPGKYDVVPKTAAPLLERATLFLESGNWEQAMAYCERALDTEPRNSHAYFIRMLAGYQVKDAVGLQEKAVVSSDDSVQRAFPVETNEDFQHAQRFADTEMEEQLKELLAGIELRLKRKTHEIAMKRLQTVNLESNPDSVQQILSNTIELLKRCQDYSDAEQQLNNCEKMFADSVYSQASEFYEKAVSNVNVKQNYKNAKAKFNQIEGFKDADALAKNCEIALKYIDAKELLEQARKISSVDDCTAALQMFQELGAYGDSVLLLKDCSELYDQLNIKEKNYRRCIENVNKFEKSSCGEDSTKLMIKAAGELNRLGTYKDSREIQQSFENSAINYTVERINQLIDEMRYLNKKKHQERISRNEKEQAMLKEFKKSNPRINVEVDRLLHAQFNVTNPTETRNVPNPGSTENLLLGIAVVVVGIVLLSIF